MYLEKSKRIVIWDGGSRIEYKYFRTLAWTHGLLDDDILTSIFLQNMRNFIMIGKNKSRPSREIVGWKDRKYQEVHKEKYQEVPHRWDQVPNIPTMMGPIPI